MQGRHAETHTAIPEEPPPGEVRLMLGQRLLKNGLRVHGSHSLVMVSSRFKRARATAV